MLRLLCSTCCIVQTNVLYYKYNYKSPTYNRMAKSPEPFLSVHGIMNKKNLFHFRWYTYVVNWTKIFNITSNFCFYWNWLIYTLTAQGVLNARALLNSTLNDCPAYNVTRCSMLAHCTFSLWCQLLLHVAMWSILLNLVGLIWAKKFFGVFLPQCQLRVKCILLHMDANYGCVNACGDRFRMITRVFPFMLNILNQLWWTIFSDLEKFQKVFSC